MPWGALSSPFKFKQHGQQSGGCRGGLARPKDQLGGQLNSQASALQLGCEVGLGVEGRPFEGPAIPLQGSDAWKLWEPYYQLCPLG